MYLVFAFMLSVIVLSGVISEHTLRRIRVTRTPPARAFAGEPSLIEVALHNGKPRLPSYSIDVEEQLDEGQGARCYFLKAAPGEELRASYRRTFPARGRVELGPLRVATGFPFALFEKWCTVPSDDALVVFPRPRPVELPRGLFRTEGDAQGSARGRGVETRELREYRAGDEARSVHWRRTAAIGRPIVRELQRDATSAVTLLLDNYVPQGDSAAAARFERDVERAVFLVGRIKALGGALDVCARGASSPVLAPGGESEVPLLTFLALLAPVTTPEPFHASRLAGSRIAVAELRDAAEPPPAAGNR
jgi:uncharacterized protein (DUF58 family)